MKKAKLGLSTHVSVPVLEFSPRQQERLGRRAKTLKAWPTPDFTRFESEAVKFAKVLPGRHWRELIDFRRWGNPAGALLFRGFPTDPELPPTPLSPEAAVGKTSAYSELWLTTVATVLGDPVAYAQESGGRHIHDVFPTPGDADKLSSRSSTLPLDYHTEMAFHPHKPDFVLLFCLRQDPERRVETRFCCVRQFYDRLSPAMRRELFRRRFRAGVDYSFGSASGVLGNGPLRRPLHGRPEDPFLCVDDIMSAETAEGQKALDHLRRMIVDHSQGVVLEPGSLLVLDDRRTAHSRTSFRAHFDGTDRWLQRLLVKRNRDAAAEDMLPGGSVIATDFTKYLGG